MNAALVSAIYGGYDRPKPLPGDLGCPAILYTDDASMVAPGWEVRYAPLRRLATPMLRAKWWKTHPLQAAPGKQISMWLDGSMTIVVDDYLQRCLDALGDDDICFTPHPWRDCLFEEAIYSAQLDRYPTQATLDQATSYRRLGHPIHWGLFASGANVRRHNDQVERHGELWWHENATRTWQDQLSLPYVTRLLAPPLSWNAAMPWHQWWQLTPHGF